MLRPAGALAGNLGRLDEAIALDRRAVAQDPLRARRYNNLGMCARRERSPRRSGGGVSESAGTRPAASTLARTYLAVDLLAQGRGDEALAEATREPDEAFRLWALAIIEHAAGRRAESDAALRELIAKYQTDSAYQIAEVYGARGEADPAFEWLERAYVQRDGGLSETKIEPSFALAARRSAVGRLPAQDGSRGLGTPCPSLCCAARVDRPL